MKSNTVGHKLAFRADPPAQVVRCFFSTLDDRERTELGTLHLALADRVPGLWDRWVELMRGAYAEMLRQATGLEVTGFTTYTPGDKN